MPEQNKIIRRSQVVLKTGRSSGQIDIDVKAGTFPAPLQLGPRSIGWIEEEVNEWIASRPRVPWAPEVDPEPVEAP